MYYSKHTEAEATRDRLEFFARWTKCRRSRLIQQTFQLYDLNYLCLRSLYKDGCFLAPRAEYRRRSFRVVSRLLKHSRYTAQLRLHGSLDLSDRAGDSLRLLTLHLQLYTDSRQLQLCSGGRRWRLDPGSVWQDEVNRRWLLGRCLYTILSRLEERRVVMREV